MFHCSSLESRHGFLCDRNLAARAFGMLEVALVGTVAFFELDFSASSPLSESESLLSEESDESLETKMIILIM